MDAAASQKTRRSTARGRSPQSAVPLHGRFAELLDQIYWVALGICVLVVPLTMAGIREYGFALVLITSLTMGVTWSVRQLLYPVDAVACFSIVTLSALAIGLVLLQLQPLSADLLSRLSPFNSRFLTLWGSDSAHVLSQPSWRQISIAPEATRSGFVLLIAYSIFFVTLIQQLQTREHVDRLVKLVALASVTMAVIGLAQVFVGNGKYLWVIDHPTRSADWPAKGTFRNQNHFAQFLALGFGPLIWWWHTLQPKSNSGSDRSRRSRRSAKHGSERQRSSRRSFSTSGRNTGNVNGHSILIMAGAVLLCLGAVLSLSRGGVAAFAVAAAVSACVLLKEQRVATRLLMPAAAIVCCAVLAFGTDEINHRLDKVRSAGSLEDVDSARLALWRANGQAIPEFWPTGAGVGSHPDVYPIWMSENFGVRFSHAESGFLQIMLETGLCGMILLCLAILHCLIWCVRGWRRGSTDRRMQIAALMASLFASLVQSVVDFVWYIPACMVLTLIIAACLCRNSQLISTQPTAGGSQARFSMVLAGVMLLGILPLGRLFADTAGRDVRSMPHWAEYRADIRQSLKDAKNGTTETLDDRLDSMISSLEDCLSANPFHNDAHAALAPLYLQRFETRLNASDNQLSLGDIRDTVNSAAFSNGQEMHEWLGRVCGDSVNDLYRARMAAQDGLARRPLRGELYIVLTETGFLTAHTNVEQQALIQQAIQLRPNDPRVLYAAGLLADESGHSTAAWKMWQRASSLDSKMGRMIVHRNIDLMPIEELLTRAASTPDMYVEVFLECRDTDREEEMAAVAQAFTERYSADLETNLEGNSTQLAGYARMLLLTEENRLAVRCLHRAKQQHPGNVDLHRQYAAALTKLDNLEHAHRELRWLRLRMPGDRQINALLQDVESRMSITLQNQTDENPAVKNSGTPIIHQVSRSSKRAFQPTQQPEQR